MCVDEANCDGECSECRHEQIEKVWNMRRRFISGNKIDILQAMVPRDEAYSAIGEIISLNEELSGLSARNADLEAKARAYAKFPLFVFPDSEPESFDAKKKAHRELLEALGESHE